MYKSHLPKKIIISLKNAVCNRLIASMELVRSTIYVVKFMYVFM